MFKNTQAIVWKARQLLIDMQTGFAFMFSFPKFTKRVNCRKHYMFPDMSGSVCDNKVRDIVVPRVLDIPYLVQDYCLADVIGTSSYGYFVCQDHVCDCLSIPCERHRAQSFEQNFRAFPGSWPDPRVSSGRFQNLEVQSGCLQV